MNLLEFEGKALLREHGLTVPRGRIISSAEQLQDFHFPAVLKSQVPVGGRGKSGGIRTVNNIEEARTEFDRIKSLKIKGYLPTAILAEESVDIRHELYVSFGIDRRRKAEMLIFSEEGGMDIEKADKKDIRLIYINPVTGLQNYHLNHIFLNTSLQKHTNDNLKNTLKTLYKTFKENKLELLEINPLIVNSDGDIICLDSKITADEVYCKRPPSPVPSINSAESTFEELTKALDINGVLLEGDIAVVTSGAGLGLATIDEINYYEGKILAFVDLGSSVYDKQKMKKAIRLIYDLNPKIILFNFNFQVASCYTLAEAISESLCHVPVVVRAKGKNQHEAKLILEEKGCFVTDDFNTAVQKTIGLQQERR